MSNTDDPTRASAELGPLDVDTLFDMPDLPATEPVPPFREELDYVLRTCGEDTPEISMDMQPCDDGEPGWLISIKMRGDLVNVGPPVREGLWLSAEELSRAARDLEPAEAYRPPWLESHFAPRIRPRDISIDYPFLAGPIRPLIMESLTYAWPWTAVGKLFVQRAGGPTEVGSGVLVGPNLLLTASHAMPWGAAIGSSIRFAPAFKDGNDPRFGSANVIRWRGVRNQDDVTGLDYVICQLDWRIGDRTGWMGSWYSSNESFYYDGKGWISIGYPISFMGGNRPALEIPVRVQDIDNDGDGLEIETHKFALGGWSGGPLWGWVQDQPRVIGIESGYEKDLLDPTRTVFAGGKHMVDLVKYGIANWS